LGGQALAREQARRKREGAPTAVVAQAERDWVGLLADAVRARRPPAALRSALDRAAPLPPLAGRPGARGGRAARRAPSAGGGHPLCIRPGPALC